MRCEMHVCVGEEQREGKYLVHGGEGEHAAALALRQVQQRYYRRLLVVRWVAAEHQLDL